MTTAENHLREWADQTLRPIIRDILRDELVDIMPSIPHGLFTPPATVNVAPIMTGAQVKEMTGWSDGTYYAKVAEMSEASEDIVIRKSKRLLFNREKLLQWLYTPSKP